MYYLATSDTASYAILSSLFTQIKAAAQASMDFKRAQGWDGRLSAASQFAIAGGLSAIELTAPDSNWSLVTRYQGKSLYFPKRNRKATRELLAQIDALPVVSVDMFNASIGSRSFSNFGLAQLPDCFLLVIEPDMVFTATDLVEILSSDYHARIKADELARADEKAVALPAL